MRRIPSLSRSLTRFLLALLAVLVSGLQSAQAMPDFARKYNLS